MGASIDSIFVLPSGTELSIEAAIGDVERARSTFVDGCDPDEVDAHIADLGHVSELLRMLAGTPVDGEQLDPFPASGTCVCGSGDWLDVEQGYVRSSRATFEDDVLYVSTDGWDDMSEDGDGARYAECRMCSAKVEVPASIEFV